jgi:hypothetical protein
MRNMRLIKRFVTTSYYLPNTLRQLLRLLMPDTADYIC